MTSSESEGQLRSRKKSRTGGKAGMAGDGVTKEGKKTRGRPRVDTQDSTAADRRRTQIRLAQRAYRQRKETTIVSLKQQSTQLQAIIEEMNSTFVKFSESALKSGLMQLNANVARDLRHANETFNVLTKNAIELENAEDEPIEDVEQVEAAVPHQQPRQPSPAKQTVDVGWGYNAINENPQQHVNQPATTTVQSPADYAHSTGRYAPHDSTSIISRRQFTLGDVINQPSHSQPQASHSQPHILPFGLIDMLGHDQIPFTQPNPHIYQVNIPTPNTTPPTTRLPTPPYIPHPANTKTLASIVTYSYDEITFARRLHRGTLEAGFRLLTAPKVHPGALNYVFKLSLPYMTIEQMRERFQLMLARGVHEDLDFWETPFIHLGGAGTHYPRKDLNGNIIKKKNGWTIRQIGPLDKRMIRVQSVDDERWEDIDGIDITGFEGEWFDAYDVQGYVEEQWHCKLDPSGPFTECLVDDEEPPSPASAWRSSTQQPSNTYLAQAYHNQQTFEEVPKSPSLTSGSSSSSTQSTTPPAHQSYSMTEAPFGIDMSFSQNTGFSNGTDYTKFNNSINMPFNQTLGLDLAPGFGYPVDTGLLADMNVGLNMMNGLQSVKQKRKKTAWLDTSKMINELLKHGVCLGRAPGFRRKYVDLAVQKSIVTALMV